MHSLSILRWSRTREAISIAYALDERVVTRVCRYDDVDFDALAARYGDALLERVMAQLAMMEAIPFFGLAPKVVELRDASAYFTPRFEALWRRVWEGVGGQWRYEQQRADYAPRGVVSGPPREAYPVRIGEPGDALVFCGGGKDSLAAITLLQRARMPFATFAYSHADYGEPAMQHALIDSLLDAAHVTRRHRMRAEDDFDDRAALVCAETPISLFYAIPLMLQHGHRTLIIGNERSADAPNLIWNGEPINHQWGKSTEAELLLDAYLREELIADGAYVSILKPLYDAAIVSILRGAEDAVRKTHSCNVAKPWCLRCAKCAYVFLQLNAFLDVDGMFDRDVLAMPENEQWYRELLGIDAHKPFECVGDADEARLAFALCRRKGLGGEAGQRLAEALPPIDVDALLTRYLALGDTSRLPVEIRELLQSGRCASAESQPPRTSPITTATTST
jgi:UDP-N-acetyl-alpha-D-muramoyl-L-alanyl-L-glutamate epimerase